MIGFLLNRCAGFLVALAAATLIVFLVLEVLPGDPARIMLGVEAQPESVKLLRGELGLDRPAPERYIAWIGGTLPGPRPTRQTSQFSTPPISGMPLPVPPSPSPPPCSAHSS